MGLAQNNFIDNDDFIQLRLRVISEACRRSSSQNGGNDYNRDIISQIPTIERAIENTNIEIKYINPILNFLNNFKNFPPENLNAIYHDGEASSNDIIYALDTLLEFLSNIEGESRQNNDDCKVGCRGLCTSTCANQCTDKCTGCTGTCNTTCKGGCGGCGGCDQACSVGCGSCGGSCTVQCGSGCYSGGMHGC